MGEARYCLKLNPEVFDYLTVDANRHRFMPSGEDWDKGQTLNLSEARRMTTGVHKGEVEHKYDYSAVLAETPAYGWLSTRERLGLWLINPSMEYLGGGPTKAELTGHLDCNPGGLPTLLNMWVGSHYGGTTLAVGANETWNKVVGPFLLYCNAGAPAKPGQSAERAGDHLWKDALARAAAEARRWPYAWVSETNYTPPSARATVTGQLALRDPLDPKLKLGKTWVGLTAPDYTPPPRGGFPPGFGRRGANFPGGFPRGGPPPGEPPGTNFPGRGPGGPNPWGGFPTNVDWQRDARFYQFWVQADAQGHFSIPNVRPGKYTLHAISEGVLGEFALTNLFISAGEERSLGTLDWAPRRFGRTVWQIGIPDRTAREFRHGDHYWQWGLYFQYPKDFPNDVNFVIGKSDWRRDWNYVQPPRIETPNLPAIGEDDEDNAGPDRGQRLRNAQPTTWSIQFALPTNGVGKATLRLAFCGTHTGCDVEAFANGRSVGRTGPLPSTSTMQRDGIRAYWIEKDISFDAALLTRGNNVIKLLSHANSWSQGVLYDCLRLEIE